MDNEKRYWIRRKQYVLGPVRSSEMIESIEEHDEVSDDHRSWYPANHFHNEFTRSGQSATTPATPLHSRSDSTFLQMLAHPRRRLGRHQLPEAIALVLTTVPIAGYLLTLLGGRRWEWLDLLSVPLAVIPFAMLGFVLGCIIDTVIPPARTTCPECGSRRARMGRNRFFSGRQRAAKCRDCKHRWATVPAGK